MALGGFFSKLFGGGNASGSAVAADPVEYKGYRILPAPIKEGGQFRTAGTIEKDVDGGVHQCRFIRADNSTDVQSATDHAVQKGKQIIDEQGDRLLDIEHI